MTLLIRRFISEGRITRIYSKGGIFLSGPGESLQELSGGKGLEGGELRENP
jgi:hypothetical protein